jgi:hypothetical protein
MFFDTVIGLETFQANIFDDLFVKSIILLCLLYKSVELHLFLRQSIMLSGEILI